MSNFDFAFAIVVKIEGGFSDDPTDRGNWTGGAPGRGSLKGTKYGLSAAVYPREDIVNLTPERVKAIFKEDYWDRHECDKVEWGKALTIFDTSVNGGLLHEWVTAYAALPLRDFLVDFQSAHLLYLASLPGWEHNRGGWVKRLFNITTLALRSPE